MSKPNIFKLATKELSQDAFFTWFLKWADSKHRKHDIALNETAKDFIRLMLGLSIDYPICKVEAGRQWHNIDIWVDVNDEFFIVIEDKTNTGEHSKQLEKYKEFATNYYKDKNHQLAFIYLKTGNESSATLNKVKGKGYSIIDRKAILKILLKRTITNEIFNDFKEHLTEIENQTNSFDKTENITSNWKASEGFYLKLQEYIPEWTDWGYVANQMGGFLGFWYHWTGTSEVGEIYIQIENSFENGIKVVIKISEWDKRTDTLYQILNEIKPFASNNGIIINKPDRYRIGETSTLAIVQNAFQSNSSGDFDFNGFLTTLNRLSKTLDDYCDTKKHSS